jgi:hypothetical protein
MDYRRFENCICRYQSLMMESQFPKCRYLARAAVREDFLGLSFNSYSVSTVLFHTLKFPICLSSKQEQHTSLLLYIDSNNNIFFDQILYFRHVVKKV